MIVPCLIWLFTPFKQKRQHAETQDIVMHSSYGKLYFIALVTETSLTDYALRTGLFLGQ